MGARLQRCFNRFGPFKAFGSFAPLTLICAAGALLLFRFPVTFALARFGYFPGQSGAGHVPQWIPTDFAVYTRAAERVSAGLNPYLSSDPSPFKYSPGALAWVMLFAVSPAFAWIFFSFFSISAWTAALIFLERGFRLGQARDDSGPEAWRRGYLRAFLWLVGLAIAWKGLLEVLSYGQFEILLFAMAAVSALLLGVSPGIAGLIAGLLPGFKLPWLLLLFPFSLYADSAKGRIRFISGYLVSTLLWSILIPVFVFGPGRALLLSQAWLGVLKGQPPILYLSDLNQSLWMSIPRWIAFIEFHIPGGGRLTPPTESGMLAPAGVGLILAGWLAGRWTARFRRLRNDAGVRATSGAGRAAVLSWLCPWLLLLQWVNPLAWRWGSAFAVGIPFAASSRFGEVDRGRRAASCSQSGRRAGFFALYTIAFLLWGLQLHPVAQWLGFQSSADLRTDGLIGLFWFSLLLTTV